MKPPHLSAYLHYIFGDVVKPPVHTIYVTVTVQNGEIKKSQTVTKGLRVTNSIPPVKVDKPRHIPTDNSATENSTALGALLH